MCQRLVGEAKMFPTRPELLGRSKRKVCSEACRLLARIEPHRRLQSYGRSCPDLVGTLVPALRSGRFPAQSSIQGSPTYSMPPACRSFCNVFSVACLQVLRRPRVNRWYIVIALRSSNKPMPIRSGDRLQKQSILTPNGPSHAFSN